MHITLLTLSLVAALADSPAPKEELLWPKGAPGAKGTEPADRPTLTLYRPAEGKANGAAVVVCPGGGYGGLAIGHEGKDIAEWLVKHGVTAFVLKYRHAPRYQNPVPLQDAQRALRTARARGKELGLDSKKIGVWGFSAGGHLASCAATMFDDGNPDADDPVQRVSCRPDFAILCYPVIDMTGPATHRGSRNNLLGSNPPAALVKKMSTYNAVTPKTPPTFLFHTSADTAVPPENSILFYRALRKAKVPAEMHIYENGPHGVGLAMKDPILRTWSERLADWLKVRGVLPK
jgi:acetyl esterase/lipase